MKKQLLKFLMLLLLFVHSLLTYSQSQLNNTQKNVAETGNAFGKVIGNALLIGLIYLIYRAITKKSEK